MTPGHTGGDHSDIMCEAADIIGGQSVIDGKRYTQVAWVETKVNSHPAVLYSLASMLSDRDISEYLSCNVPINSSI